MEFHSFEHIHQLYCQPVQKTHSSMSGHSPDTTSDGPFSGRLTHGLDPFFLDFNHSIYHHTLGQPVSQAGMAQGEAALALIPDGRISYVS